MRSLTFFLALGALSVLIVAFYLQSGEHRAQSPEAARGVENEETGSPAAPRDELTPGQGKDEGARERRLMARRTRTKRTIQRPVASRSSFAAISTGRRFATRPFGSSWMESSRPEATRVAVFDSTFRQVAIKLEPTLRMAPTTSRFPIIATRENRPRSRAQPFQRARQRGRRSFSTGAHRSRGACSTRTETRFPSSRSCSRRHWSRSSSPRAFPISKPPRCRRDETRSS